MLEQKTRRLVLKTILMAPWLFLSVSHASEPVFVPQAQWVVDKVHAIFGPLGQRSVANAGRNANYGCTSRDPMPSLKALAPVLTRWGEGDAFLGCEMAQQSRRNKKFKKLAAQHRPLR